MAEPVDTVRRWCRGVFVMGLWSSPFVPARFYVVAYEAGQRLYNMMVQ